MKMINIILLRGKVGVRFMQDASTHTFPPGDEGEVCVGTLRK